jgi:hypothetical protein
MRFEGGFSKFIHGAAVDGNEHDGGETGQLLSVWTALASFDTIDTYERI